MIHLVVGNLARTYNLQENYLDQDDLWTEIIEAAEFSLRSTVHTLKGYTPG